MITLLTYNHSLNQCLKGRETSFIWLSLFIIFGSGCVIGRSLCGIISREGIYAGFGVIFIIDALYLYYRKLKSKHGKNVIKDSQSYIVKIPKISISEVLTGSKPHLNSNAVADHPIVVSSSDASLSQISQPVSHALIPSQIESSKKTKISTSKSMKPEINIDNKMMRILHLIMPSIKHQSDQENLQLISGIWILEEFSLVVIQLEESTFNVYYVSSSGEVIFEQPKLDRCLVMRGKTLGINNLCLRDILINPERSNFELEFTYKGNYKGIIVRPCKSDHSYDGRELKCEQIFPNSTFINHFSSQSLYFLNEIFCNIMPQEICSLIHGYIDNQNPHDILLFIMSAYKENYLKFLKKIINFPDELYPLIADYN